VSNVSREQARREMENALYILDGGSIRLNEANADTLLYVLWIEMQQNKRELTEVRRERDWLLEAL